MTGHGKRVARLIGALALLGTGTFAASAQYEGPRPFVYGYAGPIHGFAPSVGSAHAPGPYALRPRGFVSIPRFLHPADIAEILHDQGFRSVDVLHRQGEVFVVNAVSPRTGQTRLILDAFEGTILERFSTARPAPRPAMTGSVPANPSPRASTRSAPPPSAKAEAPMPPRRPALQPAPSANQPVSRRPSDWAPINAVPPAALE